MASNVGLKRHRVHVKNPHIQSMAALVLLTAFYSKIVLAEYEEWRDAYLTANEPLVCMYCGKENLVKEIDDMRDRKKRSTLATIEHIKAKVNGGTDDEDNIGIACWPCNNKKANKKWKHKVKRALKHARKQKTN